MEGDLYEEFLENLEIKGATKARRRYTWTIIRSFRSYLFEYRPNQYKLSYLIMMLRHYLKTALRGIRTNKTLALINITGLSVGIATSLIIALFVMDQYLMDDFITDKDRIVRLEGKIENHARKGYAAELHPGLGPTLMELSPNVETYTRLTKASLNIKIRHKEDITFFKEDFLIVDSSFFQLFPFELVQGNPDKPFQDLSSVLITERLAQKLFGTVDPIGKPIDVNYNDRNGFVVTGVLKDIPANSSIQFDLLTLDIENYSLNSGAYGPTAIYLKLAPETNQEALAQLLSKEIANFTNNRFISKQKYRFTSFDQIKYNTESPDRVIQAMNRDVVDLFIALAVFILLLATINYINLSAARAIQRSQEAGIRKVIGAGKGSFTFQFLTESLLSCWLTLPVALLAVHTFIPAFERVLEKKLFNDYLTDPVFLLFILGLATLLGLIAGLYPAFIVSRFRFTDFLKGKTSTSQKGNWFRKGLVVFQFSISILLIIGTLMVQRQLAFVQDQTMSFQADQVLVCDRTISRKLPSLKNSLEAVSGVSQVSLTSSPPGGEVALMYGFNENFGEIIYWHEIDENYISLLGLSMIEGEAFDQGMSDSFQSQVLINETMARLIESINPLNSENPLRETYNISGQPLKIRGVVEDFHIQSLHEQIKPMVFQYTQGAPVAASMMIKVSPANIGTTLKSIEAEWKSFIPASPLKATFLDERFENLYTAEVRLGKLFGIFTLLAIIISCMGLFGLSLHISEVKMKEIGIRKVLGASVAQVIRLFSGQIYGLIAVAALIAAPLAWYFADQWLQGFAYRQELSVGTFALTLVACLVLATLTTCWYTIKTARINPVETMRNE
ncbi:MAG: ABC transporter permease [Roseivirga sp.]